MRIAACAALPDLVLPGTEMVASFAEDAGHEVVRIAGKKAPHTPDLFRPILCGFPQDAKFDVVFVNVMTPKLKWWLWKNKEAFRRAGRKVIVGGQSAHHLSDAAFEWVDVIAEGPVFSPEDLEAVLSAPRGSRVKLSWARKPPAKVLWMPGGYPPALFAKIACPNGCPYCSSVVGNWKLSDDEILAALEATVPHGRAVRVYAPDGDVSLQLRAEMWRRGRWTNASANYYPEQFLAFLEAIPRLEAAGVPVRSDAIVGVEGASERLRAALGRPLSDADFRRILGSGRLQQINLIAGLPGETDEDWEELVSASWVARTANDSYVDALVTPLEWSPWWRWEDQTAPPETWQRVRAVKARLRESAKEGNKLVIAFQRSEETHRIAEYMNAYCPFEKKGRLANGEEIKARYLR